MDARAADVSSLPCRPLREEPVLPSQSNFVQSPRFSGTNSTMHPTDHCNSIRGKL